MEVPQWQIDELQNICEKNNLDINRSGFFITKLRAYAGYRNYDQVKRIIEKYFEENNLHLFRNTGFFIV